MAMDLYINHDIKPGKIKKAFEKTLDQLRRGDFASAEVKKLKTQGLFRAKIDYENRLLFKFGRYNEASCLLILEIIFNHDYQRSRFLHGATLDEKKLEPLSNPAQVTEQDLERLVYINRKHNTFHVLDKVLSFDDFQHEVMLTPLP